EQWSPEPTRRQVLWQEFVRGSDPKEEVIQADDWAIGEPEFRRRLHRPESRAVPRGVPMVICMSGHLHEYARVYLWDELRDDPDDNDARPGNVSNWDSVINGLARDYPNII